MRGHRCWLGKGRRLLERFFLSIITGLSFVNDDLDFSLDVLEDFEDIFSLIRGGDLGKHLEGLA